MQNNNSKYLYLIIGILATLVVVLLVMNYKRDNNPEFNNNVPTDHVLNSESQSNNSEVLPVTGFSSVYKDSYQDQETGLSFAYAPGVKIAKKSGSGGFVFELRKGDEYNSITFYPDTPPHFNSSCFDMQHPVSLQNNTFYVCDVQAEAGIVRTYWQRIKSGTEMILVFGEEPGNENSLLVDLSSIVVVR